MKTTDELIDDVLKTQTAYRNSQTALKEHYAPFVDQCIKNKDVDGIGKLLNELPECTYTLSLYRIEEMIKKSV